RPPGGCPPRRREGGGGARGGGLHVRGYARAARPAGPGGEAAPAHHRGPPIANVHRDPPVARPRVAVTLGDPRGIGPEVALAALGAFRSDPLPAELVVVTLNGEAGPDEAAEAARAHRGGAAPTDAEAGRAAAGS